MPAVKSACVCAALCLALLVSCKSDRPQVPEGSAHARMAANHRPFPVLKEAGITYQKVGDELFDRKHMTQIKVSLLLLDGVDRDRLGTLLWKHYREVAERRGFEYHPRATDIYIAAFLTQEHIRSGLDQWVGMLSRTQTDTVPRLRFDDVQLEELHTAPAPKFGLSDSLRRVIFRDVMLERSTPQGPGGDTGHWRDSIAQHHNLARADLDSLAAEGLRKHWAMPPLPQSW